MPKKILIIEDEPGILVSLKDEFESQGYVVYVAEDGEKGLKLARGEKPDLIILDIMLPVLDGYEVCKRLRMEGDNTPIIMLTVKDKEVDKVLGLELGADDYVTKPFSLLQGIDSAGKGCVSENRGEGKGFDEVWFWKHRTGF
jgi:two-component system alkaline phosphatase synthesis response regulator PhoP